MARLTKQLLGLQTQQVDFTTKVRKHYTRLTIGYQALRHIDLCSRTHYSGVFLALDCLKRSSFPSLPFSPLKKPELSPGLFIISFKDYLIA